MEETWKKFVASLRRERRAEARHLRMAMGNLSIAAMRMRAVQSAISWSIDQKASREEIERSISQGTAHVFDEVAMQVAELTPADNAIEAFTLPEGEGVAEALAELHALLEELQSRANRGADVHPKHKPEVRKAVWDLTGGRCAYCEIALKPDGCDGGAFVVEHVVPVSAGGPDNLANYVAACGACNSGKSNGHVLDFIRKRMGKTLPERHLAVVGADA
jgi:hypothetical protein